MSQKNLTPYQIWGRTWVGPMEWTPARWLRWLTPATRVHFKTEMTWVTEQFCFMHDSLMTDDGQASFRHAIGWAIAPDRMLLTYDGIHEGMDIRLSPTGYVSKYRYQMPFAPPILPKLVKVWVVDDNYIGPARGAVARGAKGFDGVDLDADVMHNVLMVRWRGLPLGKVEFCCLPESPEPVPVLLPGVDNRIK